MFIRIIFSGGLGSENQLRFQLRFDSGKSSATGGLTSASTLGLDSNVTMKAGVGSCLSFGYSKKVFLCFALDRSTAFVMISNGRGSLICFHFSQGKYIS